MHRVEQFLPPLSPTLLTYHHDVAGTPSVSSCISLPSLGLITNSNALLSDIVSKQKTPTCYFGWQILLFKEHLPLRRDDCGISVAVLRPH